MTQISKLGARATLMWDSIIFIISFPFDRVCTVIINIKQCEAAPAHATLHAATAPGYTIQ